MKITFIFYQCFKWMGSNSYIKSVFRALSEIPDGPYADHNPSRYGNGSIKGLGAKEKRVSSDGFLTQDTVKRLVK